MILLTALLARRRAPVRGGGVAAARRAGASSSRSRCPAPSTASSARAMVVFTLRGQRLRHSEGDRRQLQRARHRHLQAGDRPAELQQGRGGRPDPAGAGGASPSSSTGWCGAAAGAVLRARGALRAASPRAWFDAAMLGVLLVVALLLLAVLGMAVYASFIKLWPYNLSLVPASTTVSGSIDAGVIVVVLQQPARWRCWCARLRHDVHLRRRLPAREDARRCGALRPLVRLLAVLPMAVPGMVLGLGYIFFFNAAGQSAERPVRHDERSWSSAPSCTTTRPAT